MDTNFEWAEEEPVEHEEYIGQNTLSKIRQMAQENQPETLAPTLANPPAPKGQFELLVDDIEREIASAEGGWAIKDDDWEGPRLVVYQRVSRDPRRSHNGGEYDYWKTYAANGLGIEVTEGWSCDIADRGQYGGAEYGYDCCIGLEGLKRIAQLAEVTIAARSWLAKEPGCMKRLKSAIRALDE
jgi:hypothetical protein